MSTRFCPTLWPCISLTDEFPETCRQNRRYLIFTIENVYIIWETWLKSNISKFTAIPSYNDEISVNVGPDLILARNLNSCYVREGEDKLLLNFNLILTFEYSHNRIFMHARAALLKMRGFLYVVCKNYLAYFAGIIDGNYAKQFKLCYLDANYVKT